MRKGFLYQNCFRAKRWTAQQHHHSKNISIRLTALFECQASGQFSNATLDFSWPVTSSFVFHVILIHCTGMMVGGYIWGTLADLYGRRYVLLWSLTVNGLGGLASSFSQSFSVFVLLRFISGVGSVLASYVQNKYDHCSDGGFLLSIGNEENVTAAEKNKCEMWSRWQQKPWKSCLIAVLVAAYLWYFPTTLNSNRRRNEVPWSVCWLHSGCVEILLQQVCVITLSSSLYFLTDTFNPCKLFYPHWHFTRSPNVPGVAWIIIPLEIGLVSSGFVYNSWRIYLAICTMPSMSSALFFLLMPESPKFLMTVSPVRLPLFFVLRQRFSYFAQLVFSAHCVLCFRNTAARKLS